MRVVYGIVGGFYIWLCWGFVAAGYHGFLIAALIRIVCGILFFVLWHKWKEDINLNKITVYIVYYILIPCSIISPLFLNPMFPYILFLISTAWFMVNAKNYKERLILFLLNPLFYCLTFLILAGLILNGNNFP